MAAHDLAPLLEGLALPYIQSHGRIELQRAAAGGSLRITEHHAHLLTELVNKDHHAVGTADHCGQLTQRL